MTRVVRLFRGNVRSSDVQQYGLEAEPLGRMSEKTAVQPTRVGQRTPVRCHEAAAAAFTTRQERGFLRRRGCHT